DSLIKSMGMRNANAYNMLIDKTNRLLDQGPITNATDLLEFRKQLTGIQYSKAIQDTGQLNKITDFLHIVDNEIAKVAKEGMGPDGSKAWLEAWDGAQKMYAKNKQLRSNVLWRTMTR